MSVVKRLVMGSAASWAKILVTMAAQIMVVPIFLSHWSVEEYGYWIVIQTVCTFGSLFSSGHQNYIGFEFLKAGDQNPTQLSKLFFSAIPYTLFICVVELLIIVLCIYLGWMDKMFGASHNQNQSMLHDAYTGLIVYSVAWLLLSSISGVAGRLVVVYGYFARFAWWSVLILFTTTLASAVAVLLGAGLLQTIMVTTLANLLVNLPVFWDLGRIFRLHRVGWSAPDWQLGANQVFASLALSGTTVFDVLRQQGIRMFISGYVGVAKMTEFTTVRTLSNISLQGIGTITNPLLPEMMRYLRNKEQDKIDASMGFVWFCSVVLAVPVILFFQWVMPYVFILWTRGKIPYDAHLFGVFSVTLLVFSISRPAFAILQGNNLANAQLLINAVMSILTVIGVMLLTPMFGIVGAAYILLGTEVLGLLMTLHFAFKWLERNGLRWHWGLFNFSLVAMAVAVAGIVLMIILPQHAWIILLVFSASSLFVCVMFMRQLPLAAQEKLSPILNKLRINPQWLVAK